MGLRCLGASGARPAKISRFSLRRIAFQHLREYDISSKGGILVGKMSGGRQGLVAGAPEALGKRRNR